MNARRSHRTVTPSSLTVRYVLSLMLVALLVLAGNMVLETFLAAQRNHAAVINAAGRQRLLSETLVSSAQAAQLADDPVERRMYADKLRITLQVWVSQQKNLDMDEGQVSWLLGQGENPSARVRRELEPHFKDIVKAVDGVLRVLAKEAAPREVDLHVDHLRVEQQEFLPDMEAAVLAFQRQSERMVGRLRVLVWSIGAVVLVVLLMEGLFVFRPAVDGVRAYIDQITTAREELRRLSLSDELTGLANRRKLDASLQREWARAAREGRWLAVVIMDIDHFKLYNDALGHLAGDDALVRVARQADDAVRRPPDVAGRFGGEEFMLLLPETNMEGARVLAEKVRVNVEAMGIVNPGLGDQVLTVSLGVAATQPRPGGDPGLLVEAADRALYKAKGGGRNQVVAVTI